MRSIIFILLFVPFFSFSQTLEKIEIDEFTGASLKQTSWEKLYLELTNSAFYRFRQIDRGIILDIKIMTTSWVFAVEKDNELMFILEDGSIIELKNNNYNIVTMGGGSIGIKGSSAPGISLHYYLSQNDFAAFIKSPITKTRLYTSENYVNWKIKTKHATTLQNSLRLFN